MPVGLYVHASACTAVFYGGSTSVAVGCHAHGLCPARLTLLLVLAALAPDALALLVFCLLLLLLLALLPSAAAGLRRRRCLLARHVLGSSLPVGVWNVVFLVSRVGDPAPSLQAVLPCASES